MFDLYQIDFSLFLLFFFHSLRFHIYRSTKNLIASHIKIFHAVLKRTQKIMPRISKAGYSLESMTLVCGAFTSLALYSCQLKEEDTIQTIQYKIVQNTNGPSVA